MKQLHILISVLLICFFVTSLKAEDELPSIEAIKDRITQTLSLIKNLQVEEKTVKRQRDYVREDDIYQMNRESTWTLTSDLKRHYVSTGESLNFNKEGATKVPYKAELAYDGTIARSIRYLSRNLTRPFAGQVDDYPTTHTMNPMKLTVFWEGKKTLLDIISQRPYHVIANEEIYGRDAYVMIGDPIDRDGWHWNHRIHFDMELGTQLKVAYVMKRPDAEDWIEYATWSGLDHEEVIPGVWLPKKYRYYSFTVKEDGSPIELFGGMIGSFSNWKVNQDIPADRFTMIFPDNLPVNDQRPKQNGRLMSKDEIKQLNAEAKQLGIRN
ncbi:hypothetical protein OAF42_03705 [Planctomicrobium sp.]|nr:hypothetical protein [Planctomicrobium sp.]MDA7528093.1 hypothetical protein [bacterium]MDB4733529.1 hypothetical protein [Planctomicrobium sp.]